MSEKATKIIQLDVKEYIVDETSAMPELGMRYSYFQDKETGKYYRPTEDLKFSVKPKDFEKWFVEVTS